MKLDQSEARLCVFVIGCTWKRLPGSRILYGDDLLASGAFLLPNQAPDFAVDPCAAFNQVCVVVGNHASHSCTKTSSGQQSNSISGT